MEQKDFVFLKNPARLLWLAEGEGRAAVKGIFMLLEEAQAAKFRSEGLQPVFGGSNKLRKIPASSW